MKNKISITKIKITIAEITIQLEKNIDMHSSHFEKEKSEWKKIFNQIIDYANKSKFNFKIKPISIFIKIVPAEIYDSKIDLFDYNNNNIYLVLSSEWLTDKKTVGKELRFQFSHILMYHLAYSCSNSKFLIQKTTKVIYNPIEIVAFAFSFVVLREFNLLEYAMVIIQDLIAEGNRYGGRIKELIEWRQKTITSFQAFSFDEDYNRQKREEYKNLFDSCIDKFFNWKDLQSEILKSVLEFLKINMKKD